MAKSGERNAASFCHSWLCWAFFVEKPVLSTVLNLRVLSLDGWYAAHLQKIRMLEQIVLFICENYKDFEEKLPITIRAFSTTIILQDADTFRLLFWTAEIVVSGGMSMPQILSTVDSRITTVDRSRPERGWEERYIRL